MLVRLHGQVQGVGMRPWLWRQARRCGVDGCVWNDGRGVAIHVGGATGAVAAFLAALETDVPLPARIDRIEVSEAPSPTEAGFRIVASLAGGTGDDLHTIVAPDLATCGECRQEVLDPAARRYRYPFANCTACGPRLSFIEGIPYDRAATTMRHFAMCRACAAEYADPADRRFHAQAIACAACGPRLWLEHCCGAADTDDPVAQACDLLRRGRIVAIKGLGGFQLACDACDESAVARLRERKRRERKPFALMVADVAQARRYARVGPAEEALLGTSASPIVLLDAAGPLQVARGVAPGLRSLGVMLPATPLHLLLMRGLERPIVLTSGNLSEEPQCIDNDEARARLAGIADAMLFHDRGIARRVDDSVQRIVAGAPRMLRRARGYAPGALPLPRGLEPDRPVLAMGGELKNTFCLLRAGGAVVSHHVGDLADAATLADYRNAIRQYLALFRHRQAVVAVDCHPDYLSTQFGEQLAREHGTQLVPVQHHHAHAAACMAENGIACDAEPVLAVVLDGLGHGLDGELWGGEFLLAGYRRFRRLATLRPVALPGGAQAMREPWRNTYAQLASAIGWEAFASRHAGLDLQRFLAAQPHDALGAMVAAGVNSPLASSCGRLFDAVAAAAGVCRERAAYEGQAAIEFEALVDADALGQARAGGAYPFGRGRVEPGGLPCIEPGPLWPPLLEDLACATPASVIAAKFHLGLADAVARMVAHLGGRDGNSFRAVALSGGVFQNRVLLEQVSRRLEAQGLRVLLHRHVPANDGGLSLGQAIVAAARSAHHAQVT